MTRRTLFNSRSRSWLAALLVGAGAGCSTSHYRQSADKSTYGIIQTIEEQIFKHTNSFTIDTPYSGRAPNTILPAEIIDSRTLTNQRVVTLDAALGIAVSHSREYQTQKEQLYLTALTLTGQQHRFTPQFFASVAPGIDGNGSGQYNLAALNPQVGFSQLFKSGGTLSVKLVNDLLRYYSGDPGVTLSSVLSVNIAQPLLRGFGKNSDEVEALTQAQRNVIYAMRTYTQYQKQFAIRIVNDYFSLLSLKATVRNNYANFQRRAETTLYMDARSVDRVRRSEVDQARSSELDARVSYVDSVARYLSDLDTFKITLGIPVSEKLYLDDSELTQLVGAGLVGIPVSRGAAFQLAVVNQAAILNSIDQFEDKQRKVRIAANKLKADLNIIAGARYQANDNGNVDYAQFKPENFAYNVNLQLDLPIDRLAERNAYRTTLIQFEQGLRSLSLTLDDYRDQLDRGLRTMEQRRLNNTSQLEAVKVAERRVDNNTLLLEAGRTDVLQVRQAQDDLIRAQNALVQTIVSHLQTRLQILLDMGVAETDEKQFWLSDKFARSLKPDQLGPPPLQMPENEVFPPNQFLEPAP